MKGLRDLEENVLYVEFFDRHPYRELVLLPGSYDGLDIVSVHRKYGRMLVEVSYESFYMPGDKRSEEEEHKLVHSNIDNIVRSKYGYRFTISNRMHQNIPDDYVNHKSPFSSTQ